MISKPMTSAELSACPVGTKAYAWGSDVPNFIKTARGWEPTVNTFGLYWPNGRFDQPVRREAWRM